MFIVEVPGFRELEERNISLDQVASRWAKYNGQSICAVEGIELLPVEAGEGVNGCNRLFCGLYL